MNLKKYFKILVLLDEDENISFSPKVRSMYMLGYNVCQWAVKNAYYSLTFVAFLDHSKSSHTCKIRLGPEPEIHLRIKLCPMAIIYEIR